MVQARRRKEGPNDSIMIMFVLLIVITAVFLALFLRARDSIQPRSIDPRLWLGVETIELTPDVKLQYDVLDPSGILVSRVFMGSPAELAGIKEGDVIQRWNGVSVIGQDQFQKLIQTSDPRDRVAFTIDRQGQPARVYGQVGIRPGGI
ncbi:MAG: PDZ domain-containing protein [Candidatus Omnitrophica bacterium]|nr:PDZ domain-containing protein [Candidatus Omnitrophota bacterium]